MNTFREILFSLINHVYYLLVQELEPVADQLLGCEACFGNIWD